MSPTTWFQEQLPGPADHLQAGGKAAASAPEDFWAALSLQLAIMSASPGGTKGHGACCSFGGLAGPVDSFMMLFKNELPPLFFEIFAYIHFLTFLSVFPPFPHTHTEIA